LKGYPPSNIPFPIIAYLLYFRRKVPEFSSMRRYRRFVNHWLKYLEIFENGVSRQAVHHWIKNYESLLDEVISFDVARGFVHDVVKGLGKPVHKVSYSEALQFLTDKFGQEFCMDLLRGDEEFFKEFVEAVCKFGVYSWEAGGLKHPVGG